MKMAGKVKRQADGGVLELLKWAESSLPDGITPPDADGPERRQFALAIEEGWLKPEFGDADPASGFVHYGECRLTDEGLAEVERDRLRKRDSDRGGIGR